jgi:2-oxoisovalerate dehydrogenase E1 component
MIESIDEHFVRQVAGWRPVDAGLASWVDPSATVSDLPRLLACFDAQVQSRQLDLAARWLQQQGAGFYTIGSSGHESNAAVALALRPTDPALLHYRSGGFYAARAQQVPGTTPVSDVLSGAAAATSDPISGGRHKVFGNHALSVIPQTSTIASHLPRAFGLAFSIDRARTLGLRTPWPPDAVVVASFGDASVNHSTLLGALNAADSCTSRGLPVPLLLVCEDNGFGISTPTPPAWVEQALSRWPGVGYLTADGVRPAEVLRRSDEAVQRVREGRRPVVLHLRVVRFLGHAGSDVELGYRSRADILRDYAKDPLLATAATLVSLGALTSREVLDRYEAMREIVMAQAAQLVGAPRLATAEQVMEPLTARRPGAVLRAARPTTPTTQQTDLPPLTLAATINATLTDVLSSRPEAMVFGEDVAVKGGVYGVTRGLRKRFGGHRVFDTLLDEQTILGTALGAAVAGLVPIPEIQYLAYLHNAEDQLRGEGASLAFFSNGQYRNGMVVRVAGLGYQKGFGGHFHNDNSVAVLRDIPGLVVAVPSHPAEAPALLRSCLDLAVEEGKLCVFLEPIALYHERDLVEGDGAWLAPYSRPVGTDPDVFGRVSLHGSGEDLLLVTFGNGVRMSMRAALRLQAEGVACTVLDLRWLAPLPHDDLLRHARRFRHLLVVDETRAGGGVSEGVLAVLADARYRGSARRVASRDSFVPLGPASGLVLLSESDIVREALLMVSPGSMAGGPRPTP